MIAINFDVVRRWTGEGASAMVATIIATAKRVVTQGCYGGRWCVQSATGPKYRPDRFVRARDVRCGGDQRPGSFRVVSHTVPIGGEAGRLGT